MYIRISMGQVQPGQMDELASKWRELFATRLQTMPGFQQGCFAGDRATNAAVGITFWDAEPDLALIQQHLEGFLKQAGHLAAGPPQEVTYEVLAEV